MMKRLAGLMLATLLPLGAAAQEAAVPTTLAPAADAHRHRGFFFRPELGYGYLGTSMSVPGSPSGETQKLSGGGGVIALAIGGAVSEDLSVAGQAWAYMPNDATLTSVHYGIANSVTTPGPVVLAGVGVLLNWYFTPSNVYLAVTPSITVLGVWVQGGWFPYEYTTDLGLGVRAALGKEWRANDHWGLGVAVSLALSKNKLDYAWDSATYRTFCAGLTFSATYN